MEWIATAFQAEYTDRRTAEMGMPSPVLMERAAYFVFLKVLALEKVIARRCSTVIVCGKGNNGGDGVAAARMLATANVPVIILLPEGAERYSEELRLQISILEQEHFQIPPRIFYYGIGEGNEPSMEIQKAIVNADMIVDAMFGIGLKREISGIYAELIRLMNRSAAHIISVDIPSGIDTDTGEILGTAVKANHTVTFGMCKPGHFFAPGRLHCGKIECMEIGFLRNAMPKSLQDMIDKERLSEISESSTKDDIEDLIFSVEAEDLPLLPKRNPFGNKSDFGKVLIAAGSPDIYGAAYLAALGAFRSGCGMVKIVTAKENHIPLNMQLPEAMYLTYSDAFNKHFLESLRRSMEWADTILAGPGMGTSPLSLELLKNILLYLSKKHTLVLDADALNLLSLHPELYEMLPQDTILTPHMGEMSRLCGISIPLLKKHPLTYVSEFAKKHHCICIQKDACTTIASESMPLWINRSGNDALATAGSGDVLAGLIAGLCAQWRNRQIKVPLRICKSQSGEISIPSKLAAAIFGVYLHGLCGEKCSEKMRHGSVIASDLIQALSSLPIS